MGMSPKTLEQMKEDEDSYRAYIRKLEDELEKDAQKHSEDMQKCINDYYKENEYDKKDFISGKNADFMQQSDWSLKNVKTIIDAISKSIFGEGKSPEGVTIEKVEEVGKAIAEMKNMELYIAGKCFEVISGIVESFGSASSVSFNSDYKDEPLGNGLHLFTTVVCSSYKSTSFFNNNEIYQYLFIYEVKYSVKEAEQEAKLELTELYEDQIVTFKKKVENLLTQLEEDKITPEQFDSSNEIYNGLIAKVEKKLKELELAAA